jgi:acrylyl-CoA reductase (NADPH)
METTYRAFVVNKTDTDFSASVATRTLADLPPGAVTVRVAYSGMNYKDGLACQPNGQIIRRYPLVPGIDLAGTVEASEDARFVPGMPVIVTSYGLGVMQDGGFAQYARVPAEWVVPLPEGLTVREAMTLGTAGFTAALALHRLEANGVAPENGTILVTGASGGVGSTAVALLARRGYAIAASTGKATAHDYLRMLGATEIIPREELSAENGRPLEKERWAGAIDAVGGVTLANVLRAVRYGGAVAACGLPGGAALATTVHPFLLRGVSLLGIDSVQCPMPLRQMLWQRLATDWKPAILDAIVTRVAGLNDIGAIAAAILRGEVQGRVLIDPWG